MSKAPDPTHHGDSFVPLADDRSGEQLAGPVRTWAERARGWPEEVPVDNALRRRATFELSRTSVGLDLLARTKRSGIGMPASSAGLILLIALAPQSHHLALVAFNDTPILIGLWLVSVVALEWWGVTRLLRRITGPRLRAGLRREGVDCCVRCGHLMGRGGPADTCAECGLDHEHLPLGWGPGPIGAPAPASRPTPASESAP